MSQDPKMHGQGLTAPHLLHPEDRWWGIALDVTSRHGDLECTRYAFGMPSDMPNWDEPRVRWVELVVCAEFDIVEHSDDPDEEWQRVATGYDYFWYIMDDADAQTDDDSGDYEYARREFPKLLKKLGIRWSGADRRPGEQDWEYAARKRQDAIFRHLFSNPEKVRARRRYHDARRVSRRRKGQLPLR